MGVPVGPQELVCGVSLGPQELLYGGTHRSS
jgi:hypothetical protein